MHSIEALITVGSQIERKEDLADLVPWYYALEGSISNAQTFWNYVSA